MEQFNEDQSRMIERFKAFLKIPTVSAEGPKGSYQEAVNFLQNICENELGFSTKIVEIVEKKPILIARWDGRDTSLPCVLLNSHYDVVPAVLEKWNSDPFEPIVNEAGHIIARGTQDMKCVCMQYLEALIKIKASGEKPLRTIYLTFVPDEEQGGIDGMCKFVDHPEFKAMNIGVALDEGLANPSDKFTLFYGERSVWWAKITVTGPTGHASRFIQNTAVEKLTRILGRIHQFRAEQEALLGDGGCAHAKAKKLGDVTTINVTMIDTGVYNPKADGTRQYALNVIPIKAEACFDTRFPPHVRAEDYAKLVSEWTAEEGTSWDFVAKTVESKASPTDENKAGWWSVLKNAFGNIGVEVEPEIFPAATDSRFLREVNVPAYGFSPMRRCPIMLHEHNEFIPASVYLEGVQVYEKLLWDLANATPEQTTPVL